jgi:formyltetrahydrofolate deformylase
MSAGDPGLGAEHGATILVSCPDRRGLVAALAQLLYGQGINILMADQYTDASTNTFFQRVHVDLHTMRADRTALERAIDEVARRFEMKWSIAYGSHRKRVAIMVSRYDHCLHDLLLRQRSGELACDIPLVISNHADLQDVGRMYGIPFHALAVTADTKLAQEAQVLALLERERIDLLVLARYMQVLSPRLCDAFVGRAINIHHSFLPAFVGGRPYHQAHARGVKVVGATAHYVTANLDEGPIIEQDVMQVSHRDSVDDLIRKGRDLERVVLSRAVRHHLEDRIIVAGNKTVVF